MIPERFLGSDPTPGDLAAVDQVLGVVRDVVVVLTETRQRIDEVVGPESIWQGSEVEPIVDGMSRLSVRLRTLEEAVVAFAGAWQAWRSGVANRQDATAELVEEMSQLAGIGDAEPRREDVRRRSADLAARHDQEAADLVGSCEDLIAAVSTGNRDEEDLASALSRGFGGLREAVDEWIRGVSIEMQTTTGEVDDVAEVTAVAPQLIGVGAGSGPITSEKAWQIAAKAPASYRLKEALRRDWPESERPTLQPASFAKPERRSTARSIADRIRGITRGGDSS
ncbi:hypothetical protein MU582_15435 [Nocardioidaceae bacterium SCSIO 66511]|nr:hypothetical protein MU582_15435 [Nocardioidaceae bacterium SCSIO 66511]